MTTKKSKSFGLTLPEPLYKQLKKIAEEEYRSLSSVIVVLITNALKSRKK